MLHAAHWSSIYLSVSLSKQAIAFWQSSCKPGSSALSTSRLSPPLRKLSRKCFIMKQRKRSIFCLKGNVQLCLRRTDYSFVWCFLNIEIAHSCWTETLLITFTYFGLSPFEMYKKFIYSSKCNIFQHSTCLGSSLFTQYVLVLWTPSVTSRVKGKGVGRVRVSFASCGKGNYTFHFF